MIACNHEFKYVISQTGLMDYGGSIVAGGLHNLYRCIQCGKSRWKIPGKHTVIIPRKQNKQQYQINLL